MKIELHLTLPEFEALRDYLDPTHTPTHTLTPVLTQVWHKVDAIDQRLQTTRALRTRFHRGD